MGGVGESRRSLERLLIGGPVDESQEGILGASNRDFAATLAKEKSVASKSERSDDKVPLTISQNGGVMNPTLEDIN